MTGAKLMKKWNWSRNILLMLAVVAIAFSTAAFVGAQGGRPGREDRPVVGIRIDDSAGGILITDVVPLSPAAAADLQVNDIITAVNGAAVEQSEDVVGIIRDLEAGDTVAIDVMRNEEALTLEVTLGSLHDMDFGGRGGRIDMLDFTYDASAQTWTIERLSEDSPLYEAGLREGDVITQINGESVTPQTFADMLRDMQPNSTATLTIERDGEAQDIEIESRLLVFMAGFAPFGGMFGDGGMAFPGMRGMQNGYLGVQFETLEDGARLIEVMTDSPANIAGLQVDDVVTAVNGEAVNDEHTLRDRLVAYEPEDVVTLTVTRGDETLEIEVPLGQPAMMEFGGMFFPGGMGNGMMEPPAAPAAPNL
jgi:S1-C subfamily serine protease